MADQLSSRHRATRQPSTDLHHGKMAGERCTASRSDRSLHLSDPRCAPETAASIIAGCMRGPRAADKTVSRRQMAVDAACRLRAHARTCRFRSAGGSRIAAAQSRCELL
ncbi:Hypothetical protein XFF4834R_chr18200 [Xanthomonas citri pv. fuscans]|nr:Hypothetical protein XFF4834R_chr18200 [Xanthomonas citri pv. fuscans]